MSIQYYKYYKYKVLSRWLALMAVLRLNMIPYIYRYHPYMYINVRHIILINVCILVLSCGHKW